MANLQRFTQLAELVADGQTVDWDSAASGSANDVDQTTLDHLRAVASIARLFATVGAGRPYQAREPIPLSGSTWGSLRVLEHVGSGRFGDVYRAWDPALDREVALKIQRPAEGSETSDTQVIEEGRVMARVRHPNVVAIYGAQRLQGVTGLWMEFVRGRTLAAELAERGPFPAEDISAVGIELCQALEAVHAAGLVHRDVKAPNVLRDESGRIVLGDFGTGRDLAELSSSSRSLAGTPTYLAPELFENRPISAQSDLYSLGVLLFYLATQKYPVPGRSLRELRDAHAQGRRTSLSSLRPDLPKRLVEVIEKALHSDPTRRFDSAMAIRLALERIPARRLLRARLQMAVCAVIAVGAVSAFTWPSLQTETVSIPFVERDWVLVTAFENETGDSSLDGALEYALERELSNSTFVNVVPRARIEDTLRLMRKPLDTPVDAEVGLELALRDGAIRAAIVGRVERTRGTYSISVRILNPANASTAGAVTEESIARDDLVAAVERVATEISRRLGETLLQIGSTGNRLEKVATPSLRALQLYSEAKALTSDVVLFSGTAAPRAAEQLLSAALALDRDFIWAHILMAHALNAQGGRNAEVIDHVERAAAAASSGIDRDIALAELNAFRGRFTSSRHERTRYFEEAVSHFEAALQMQPDHLWASVCLMNISDALGRFPGKHRLDRYVAMRPNHVGVLEQAMRAALAAGDIGLAREYAGRGSALDVQNDMWQGFYGNDAANLRMFPARVALLERNASQALFEADRLAADPRSRQPGAVVNRMGQKLADLYRALGRLDRVEQVATWIQPESSGHRLLAAAGLERENPAELRPLLHKLFPSPRQALGGHGGYNASVSQAFVEAKMFEQAGQLVDVWRSQAGAESLAILVDAQLALAQGRVTHGVQLLDELTRIPDQFWIRRNASLLLARSWMGRGEYARAVTTLEDVVRQPLANPFESLIPEYLRVRERLAQAYRGVGRISEAEVIEADLRKILAVATDDHPMKRRLSRIGS
jgi:serine/threonine-protein kinase